MFHVIRRANFRAQALRRPPRRDSLLELQADCVAVLPSVVRNPG
jgi:hypothetical protein